MEFFAVSCRALRMLEMRDVSLRESWNWRRSIARMSWEACWRISAPVGPASVLEVCPTVAADRRAWNEVEPAAGAPVALEGAWTFMPLASALTLIRTSGVFRVRDYPEEEF